MKQFTHPYFNAIASLLTELDGAEAPYIETASQWTAQTLCQGNIIHTFGCGHSLSPALEPFHRSAAYWPNTTCKRETFYLCFPTPGATRPALTPFYTPKKKA